MTDILLPPRHRQSTDREGEMPAPTAPLCFDDFYRDSSSRVVRQLHAMTGDLAEAQDCVAEAYVRAWQRWAQVGRYDAPEAWVRQVAWRLAASKFRRAKIGAGLLRRQGVSPDVPSLDPDRVALVAALRQLPEAQRVAVVLHHLADRSVAEIAQETGTAVGTVKTRLSRGRAALSALLTENEADRG